ncbi:hypothetical protein [Thermogymnomonas acidicola]|uniref:hypothetical protein n=1 Tax=Thermogymnomonas acidicola TaxID=399579 RepID=UPI0014947B42|nr:hypothetical protein [Thermogymnomonas acidicola]
MKFKKRAGDFSLGTVALNVVFESGGNTVKEAGIAVASLGGPKPLEITDAEEYLRGKELNSNAAEHVARIVSERVEPVADYYGDVDFKRRIARAITLEAFRRINVKVGG